jgi:SAM-dependent methyltransferase
MLSKARRGARAPAATATAVLGRVWSGYYRLPRQQDLLAAGWNVLILMGACRADRFLRLGDASAAVVRSLAPCGRLWVREFGDQLSGAGMGSVLWVTADRALEEECRLYQLLPVRLITVGPHPEGAAAGRTRDPGSPEDVNEEALAYLRRHGQPLRLVVQYCDPCVGGEGRLCPSDDDDLPEAYEASLGRAWRAACRLTDDLKGKVVITACHGELLGERGRFGHECHWLHEELRRVPWLARDMGPLAPAPTATTVGTIPGTLPPPGDVARRALRARSTFARDREVVDGKLAYYAEPATPDFWARYWVGQRSAPRDAEQSAGHTEAELDLMARLLPQSGKVLEGGCGMGEVVQAMRDRGIDCEGMEWSREVVQAAENLRPGLPIRRGDVTAIDVPDGYYAGYISLGVIEHRQDGPEPFLKEASRVLRTGGTMVVSVPYYSPLRRLKALCGLVRRRRGHRPFFQYAMTPDMLRMQLRRHGLTPLRTFFTNAPRCVGEEAPWVARLANAAKLDASLRAWLLGSPAAGHALGHMVAVVARKEGRSGSDGLARTPSFKGPGRADPPGPGGRP